MSGPVPRTCTEIRPERRDGAVLGETKPLSRFRDRPALVLLGDPGIGKTTEFQQECKALGSAAEYVKARDFINLDIASRPEWSERTLFIDGLDEIRAGTRDYRQALDAIRGRLDQLRPPRFRVSCREADWLGPNDRENLAKVAPARQVTVVRLDPLDDEAIRQLLSARMDGNADDLIAESLRRGIWPLLKNPLMLELLAGAAGDGRQWPESRRETFEMACRALATEQNSEHRIATSLRPADAMKAGGYLCALQLLSGLEGYSRLGGSGGSGHVELDDIQAPPGMTREVLEGALGTKLFAADAEGMFHPYHRQVAEFLGGRYLAELIESGLPAGRVLSLMTGPSDGHVVTALRGLSAWMAVHCSDARGLLIDADPFGVGLYGDIAAFSRSDRIRLLRSLADVAEREPPSAVFSLYDHHTAWTLRSLVSADMADVIHRLIGGRSETSSSDRVVGLMCRILSQVKEDQEALAGLAPSLIAVVRDIERPSWVRTAALDAYINIAPAGETKELELWDLLRDSQDSASVDPDDQLRGTLLKWLYPEKLPPAQVWRYAGPRHHGSFYGQHWRFWNQDLAEASSNQQMGDVLDALHAGADEILPSLVASGYDDLPHSLVAQAVQRTGADISVDRLNNWLSTLNHPVLPGWPPAREGIHALRTWLEQRPEMQKGIILKRLGEDLGENGHGSSLLSLRRTLQSSKLPPDLGAWCLDQALGRVATEPALSVRLLRIAHRTLSDPSLSEGLTLGEIRQRVHNHEDLAREFETLLSPANSDGSDREDEWRRKIDQIAKEKRADRRQERAEWEQLLSEHESKLWDNTFSPANLDTLALAYFGAFGEDASDSPFERLREFIGGGRRLAEAVMAALRGSLWREDLPDVDKTISLFSQSKRPYLAHPVHAGMHRLMDGCEPARPIEDTQKRRGLAMYFLFPRFRPEPRGCLEAWFHQDPVLVLDVLHRCAAAAIRKNENVIPAVYDLESLERHEDLVNATRLRLLGAFPARIPSRQLPRFDWLLGKALRHRDRTSLGRLAEKKLALKSLGVGHRVRWLTVAALLLGGSHTRRLEDYATTTERRVRHLTESLAGFVGYRDPDSVITRCRDSEFLAGLIGILGPLYSPQESNGVRRVTLQVKACRLLESVIGQLSKLADGETRHRLEDLVKRPELVEWRERLTWALQTQRPLLRDASYLQPGIEQVQATLNDLVPANVADLTALLCDRIADIYDSIRGDNTNLWRQFWNEDSHGRTRKPKPEDSCRDALLESLKQRLPSEIDAEPEGSHAAGRRSDIRVSHHGLKVPIEIKKNSHRHLWSALHNQLIDRYTTDRAASGHGIYLVLWFGADQTTPPPDGNRPATTTDLRQALQRQLLPQEQRRIEVIVIDVTKPG